MSDLAALAFSYPSGQQTVQGQWLIDAVVSEQPAISAQVTEHAVERGANVADHIRPLPRRITLDCYISNVPIDPIAGTNGTAAGSQKKQEAQNTAGTIITFSGLVYDNDFQRARYAYDDIEQAILNGAIWTITTNFKQYENFAATQFTPVRTAEMGDSLHFTIEFSEIRFVDSQEVPGIPQKQKVPKSRKDKGEKPATPMSEEDKRGFLEKLTNKKKS